MSIGSQAGDGQTREQSLYDAQQLAATGQVDHAVRRFIDADAHLEAAHLLEQHDRIWEAIHVLYAVVTLDAEQLAVASGEARECAIYAAALLERSGDPTKATKILDALAPLEPDEEQRFVDAVMPPERSAVRGPTASGDQVRAQVDPPRSSTPRMKKMPRAATSGARPRVPTGLDAAVTPAYGTELPLEAYGDLDTVPPPSLEAYSSLTRDFTGAEPETREYPREETSSGPRRQPSSDKPVRRARSTAPPSASKAPVRRARSTAPPSAFKTPTTVRPEGLRKPSSPDIEVEQISVLPPRPSSGERGAVTTEATVERSLAQLLAAGRKDAAAQVAFAAGRFEQALEWYIEVGLHHGVGACLAALERHEEAITHLSLTRTDGPHYREACREIAKAAISLGRLDPATIAYVLPYVESGPRSDRELSAFLDFAELLNDAGHAETAKRGVAAVLRLNPDHPGAQLLRAVLGPPSNRRRR